MSLAPVGQRHGRLGADGYDARVHRHRQRRRLGRRRRHHDLHWAGRHLAGTLARVSVACDLRTVAPVLEAIARGEHVPVNVEPWQVIAGDVPESIPEATA